MSHLYDIEKNQAINTAQHTRCAHMRNIVYRGLGQLQTTLYIEIMLGKMVKFSSSHNRLKKTTIVFWSISNIYTYRILFEALSSIPLGGSQKQGGQRNLGALMRRLRFS